MELLVFLGWTLGVFLIGCWIGRETFGTFRQNIGELMVIEKFAELRPHLDFSYHLINNITVPSKFTGTSQIDHILVCAYGIFVFETTKRKGFISGGISQKQWVQRLGRNIKFEFPNPIRQNLAHILALSENTNLPEELFYNVVVFSGDCHLDADFGEDVIYLSGLKDYLNMPREHLLDRDEIAMVVGKIEMCRKERSLETDEQHINAIREYIRR
jgi:hypothetical protein